jgi:hypothetical protein
MHKPLWIQEVFHAYLHAQERRAFRASSRILACGFHAYLHAPIN